MDDAADHGVEVFQDFYGGDAKCVEADFFQVSVTGCVALRAIATTVEFSVYFDCEAYGEASEVQAIPDLRVLATEPETAGFLPKGLPEKDLGKGHFSSSGSRLLHILYRCAENLWRA